MKLVLSLCLLSLVLAACGKKKKRVAPKPSSEQHQPVPGNDGNDPRTPIPPEVTCHYRYEMASQEMQWDNLRPFIGVWISKKSELGEKRLDNGTLVYTKNGVNVESEISFRPIQFIYSDPLGQNLIGIDDTPAHSIKMSKVRYGEYFVLQRLEDLRPSREKCSTFGIRLLKGNNVLEVLGPERGDSLGEPLPIEDFFNSSPSSEKFQVFEQPGIN